MWYAIGYDEVVHRTDENLHGYHGLWRMISGPHQSARAAARALGKALTTANGASPQEHGVYSTMTLVVEEELAQYNLRADTPRLVQKTFDVVAE